MGAQREYLVWSTDAGRDRPEAVTVAASDGEDAAAKYVEHEALVSPESTETFMKGIDVYVRPVGEPNAPTWMFFVTGEASVDWFATRREP